MSRSRSQPNKSAFIDRELTHCLYLFVFRGVVCVTSPPSPIPDTVSVRRYKFPDQVVELRFVRIFGDIFTTCRWRLRLGCRGIASVDGHVRVPKSRHVVSGLSAVEYSVRDCKQNVLS